MSQDPNSEKLTADRMRADIKQGLKDATPLVVAVFPIGVTFGMIALKSGLSYSEAIMFSAIAFSPVAQLAAIGLVGSGAGFVEIILTALFLNLRLLLFSAGLSPYLRKAKKTLLPPLAFVGVIGPSFGLVMAKGSKGERLEAYMFTIGAVIYISIVIDTIVGALAGESMPSFLKGGMSFAFSALLVGLIVAMVRYGKVRLGILVVLIAGLLALGLNFFMPESWSVMVGAVVGATVGAVLECRT